MAQAHKQQWEQFYPAYLSEDISKSTFSSYYRIDYDINTVLTKYDAPVSQTNIYQNLLNYVYEEIKTTKKLQQFFPQSTIKSTATNYDWFKKLETVYFEFVSDNAESLKNIEKVFTAITPIVLEYVSKGGEFEILDLNTVNLKTINLHQLIETTLLMDKLDTNLPTKCNKEKMTKI